MKLILATNNRDKLREIREILPDYEILSQSEAGCHIEAEETGATFIENARIKARAACAVTGLPCVADDSGLEVDAMEGGPGVYSSRYNGGEPYSVTNDRIISIVDADGRRGARFRCAVACVLPNGDEIDAEGVIEGAIARAREGDHGFGYDPIFIPEGHSHTMACLTDDEKNAISHRGRAFRQFAKNLTKYMEMVKVKE